MTVTSTASDSAPIAYQPLWTAQNPASSSKAVAMPITSVPQPKATDEWTLAFWAKTADDVRLVTYCPGVGMTNTALPADGRWHYVTKSLTFDAAYDLSGIA